GQDLVADRAGRIRDLVERDDGAEQLDPTADARALGRHAGDIDAEQIHRHAADDRHAYAAQRRDSAIAQAARIAVRVTDADDGDSRRRRGDIRCAITDRAGLVDLAQLQDTAVQRRDGLHRVVAARERIAAVERDAGAHEVTAMRRVD